MIKSVDDLDVFKRAYRLALEVHRETVNFPAIARNEIGSQLRRASKSIPANIAEGFSRRKFNREYKRYLEIARASCDESHIHLRFARDLSYLAEIKYQYYLAEYQIVGKQLTALIKVWASFSKEPKNPAISDSTS